MGKTQSMEGISQQGNGLNENSEADTGQSQLTT